MKFKYVSIFFSSFFLVQFAFANDVLTANETQIADDTNPQVVEFSPEPATAANTEYKITINSIDYSYISLGADSVQTIVEDLQVKLDANTDITCTEDDIKIICTSNEDNTNFINPADVTNSTAVIQDSISPIFQSFLLTGGTVNSGNIYAKEGDDITITLKINPSDTWKSGNNADFSIGLSADLNTGNFTFSADNETTRNKTYTILSGQNGEFSFTELDFSDQYNNAIMGFTASDSLAQNIIVDTTLPVIIFTDDVSPTPVQSDDVIITITDNNADTSSYKYILSGNNTCDNTTDFSSAISFTTGETLLYSTETNNTKYICVKAKDLAGNISYLSSTNALNIDISAPSQPSLPADLKNTSDSGDVNTDNITNNTTPTFSVICSESDSTIVLYDGATKIGEKICTAIGTESVTADILSEGNHSIVYTEKDVAGNESVSSSALFIEIDITAPELQSFSSSTANGTYGPAQTILLTAQYNTNIGQGSSLSVVLNNGVVVTLDTVVGSKITGIYTVGATGSNEDISDVNIANILSQNAKDIYANALTSTNLGTSNIENTSDINIDTTAPEIDVTVDVVISSNNANTGTNIESKAKAGDEITLKFTTNEEVQNFPIVQIAGQTAVVTNPSADKRTFIAKYTVVSGDTNGEVSIDIVFTDIFGNEVIAHVQSSTGNLLSKVEIDTVNSVSTVQTIYSNNADSAKAKSGDEITIEFTTNEEVQNFPTVWIAEKIATVTNPSADKRTFIATYVIVDTDIQGKAKIEIGLFDTAGNETVKTEKTIVTDSSEVIIDTIKPILQEIVRVVTPKNDTTPDYTFSTDEAGNILYSGACSAVLQNAIVGNNSITLNALSQNRYTSCGVSVQDATGNISEILIISSFLIDVTPPTISIHSGVTYIHEGQVYTDAGATCSDSLTSCTVSVSNLVNNNLIGDYIITYIAVDAAGNYSTATRPIRVISAGTGGQDATLPNSTAVTTSSSGGGGGGGFSSGGSSSTVSVNRPIISNIFPEKNSEFINLENIKFSVSSQLKTSTLQVVINNSVVEKTDITLIENNTSYSVSVNTKNINFKEGINYIAISAEGKNSTYYNPSKIEVLYTLKKVTKLEEIIIDKKEIESEIKTEIVYLDTTNIHILELTKRGIINGTKTEEGYMFYPQKSLNRAEAVKIVVNGFLPQYENKLNDTNFPDIEKNIWFEKYVISASENGIITGYDDGEFKGLNSLSNIEALVIIARAAKVDISKYILDAKYSEIKPMAWYAPYLAWALESKLITEKDFSDITFEITRENFIKLNYLYLIK